MSKKAETLMGLALIPVSALWTGFILSVMWGWFVVPLGVRPINWAAGYGLTLVAGLLRMKIPKKDEREAYSPIVTLIGIAFGASVLLGFGWIVHHWVAFG